MDLRVYKIIEKTYVEGPGVRFCIWVQGCSRHCDGCWQTGTWDKAGGVLMSIDEIFEKIKRRDDIEGVTFLGGEPFEQALPLGILAKKIQEISLSVLTFTGFYVEELQKMSDDNVKLLLENTDLLIDGPFVKEKYDLSRPWVGSKNQRYNFLTNRYNEEDVKTAKNKFEVRVNKDGAVFINGMGDFEKTESMLCCRL